MTDILVTGAGGFIGQVLLPLLDAKAGRVFSVFRNGGAVPSDTSARTRVCRDIGPETEWADVLGNIEVILHLAGIAHNRESPADFDGYRLVNVEGTRRLALEASKAGVKRFVFLSSIKVHGEQTRGAAFSVADDPDPQDAYAVSKMEAETALREIERRTNLEVVIIRPPLVYGPFAKGNLAALSTLIERGVPIPSAGIRNRRDLISVYNLCDLILTCIRHPAAAGKTFLACDGQVLCTRDIVRYLASANGRSAREIYMPVWLLGLMFTVAGKRAAFSKFAGDLEIDMEATRETLDWNPPYSVEEAFNKF